MLKIIYRQFYITHRVCVFGLAAACTSNYRRRGEKADANKYTYDTKNTDGPFQVQPIVYHAIIEELITVFSITNY